MERIPAHNTIAVFEEPKNYDSGSHYAKSLLSIALLVVSCVALPGIFLFTEESLLLKLTISTIVLLVLILVWYGQLARQRLRIFSDSIQPARRPIKCGLLLRSYVVPVSEIQSARIVGLGYREEWFDDIEVTLKSGENLHLNRPLVNEDAFVHLKETLSAAGVTLEKTVQVNKWRSLPAKKRAARSIIIGYACFGLSAVCIIFISYVAEVSLIPAILLSAFGVIVWTILSIYVYVHTQ